MARYLVVSDGTVVGDVEAKNMKSAVLSLNRVGTYTAYRVEGSSTLTLREVVQLAIEVDEDTEEEEEETEEDE